MHHPNGHHSHQTYSQNVPYQQLQSHQTSIPFQPQQFGPRFQSPPQHFTPPSSFCQSPRPHHDQPRHQYQSPVNSRPTYPLPVQNFNTLANSQYPPSHGPPGFSPPSIPSYKTSEPPIQNYNQPPIQNYNRFPPIQTYNQPPVQSYNNNPPIPNYNQPPSIQNYNQPATPPHQPMNSSYQFPSPGYGPPPNTPYQPQSSELSNLPYQLPIDQCYQQQPHPTYDLPKHEFNQRPPFRPPGHQRFPFKSQMPKYQQPQHGKNKFQFHPKQQYQNFYPKGPPPSFDNQSNIDNSQKKDKLQIACELGDCDFVGHPGAVKEHKSMHHRLGLHKKVLYSNNSDAVKNWIEERKKKWPTKDTIQTKLEVEDEKNKRGERIADDDFQRFNNKNNKFNHKGSKRFDNRKRGRPNNPDFIEIIEDPMNGNLKRFAGIVGIINQEEHTIDETSKPIVLKLLEAYAESSDDEPPEEIAIVKESILFDNQTLIEPEGIKCSTSEIENVEHNEKIDSTTIVENNSKTASIKVKIENDLKINGECKISDSEHGQKRKKNSMKDPRPIKKLAPMRTPRTEVMERKGALLEALMGDLMRKERNTITQCICYIRNNMHRFGKIQAA